MITQDQTEVVEFLASPPTHGGAAVERIETHASIVFLAGTRAWKLKRAVRYDYLDFSTVERRQAMCEAELRINRRTAPDLYRGVVAVTREPDGSLALGGPGTPVDWLRRDGPLRSGRAVRSTGRAEDARSRRDASAGRRRSRASIRQRSAAPDHGGAAGMAWVVDGNAAGFAEQGAGVLDAALCATVTSGHAAPSSASATLLDARARDGFVRQCHGDLHLRNIVLLDGRPTLFDAIEFNDEIACIDVLYDLAFLLMDLWRRRLPRHANVVWNGYLGETVDLDGTAAAPAVPVVPRGGPRQDERHGGALQEDPHAPRRTAGSARERIWRWPALLHPPRPAWSRLAASPASGKSTAGGRARAAGRCRSRRGGDSQR